MTRVDELLAKIERDKLTECGHGTSVSNMICPECGGGLQPENGCFACYNCGFSQCG